MALRMSVRGVIAVRFGVGVEKRIMVRKRNGRSKLLVKYIKINFCVIFLPIIIGSIVYCFLIQNNYREKYLDTIEYSADKKMWQLENVMKSFLSIANQISMDKELTPYHLQSSSYAGARAIDKLKSYEAESAYFHELVVSLNDSDQLYTGSGVVDMDTYLTQKYHLSASFSEEDFRQLIHSRKRFGTTREGQYATDDISRYSIATYPIGEVKGTVYGTLTGLYEMDWEEAMGQQSVDGGKGIVIVCTDAMEILYAHMPGRAKERLVEETDQKDSLYRLLMSREEDREYYDFSFDGVDYIGKIMHSDVNGWYLVDMVSEHAIIRDLWMTQFPLLAVIFLSMLLLTIVLSFLLSVYNYLPIQRLYHLFEKKRSQASEDDELLLLNEYIRNLLEEQNVIEERLADNMRISRMEVIKRLLRSSLDTTQPEVQERLESMGIRLDKKYMATVVIKLSGKEKKKVETKLKSAMHESGYGRFYLTENVYKGYDAFLACADETEEMDEFAGWLVERMGEETEIRIGLSDVCGSVESLKYSLIEAIIAVESGETQITHFSNIAIPKNGEFYCKPLESERRLKQLMIQGKADDFDKALNGLQNELLYIWKSCSDTVKHFMMNRVLGFLFEDALSLNQNAVEKYLHYSNLEEFMEKLREFGREELDCRMKLNALQEDGRMRSILAFVDENYMRPEMSLDLMAEKFNMTAAHFSRIFKAAMGKTFIQYITDRRLNLAAQLLADTEGTVSEIVDRVGYSDTPSFIRKFTRHFHVSPGNYRKISREKKFP